MRHRSAQPRGRASSAYRAGLAAALVSLELASIAQGQQAVQWRTEDGGNGHWYVRSSTLHDWPAANAAAAASGAHLATLTSPGENQFLLANGAQRNDGLGGFAPESQGCNGTAWAWVTGEPWSFAPWASPEPNYCNETILTYSHYGFPGWNNFYSQVQLYYWFEWSADCNSDGVVDYGQILDGTIADQDGDNVPDCCAQGIGCSCPADLSGDGSVGPVDLAIVLEAWGATDAKRLAQGDADGSGAVDGGDLSVILFAWGTCP